MGKKNRDKLGQDRYERVDLSGLMGQSKTKPSNHKEEFKMNNDQKKPYVKTRNNTRTPAEPDATAVIIMESISGVLQAFINTVKDAGGLVTEEQAKDVLGMGRYGDGVIFDGNDDEELKFTYLPMEYPKARLNRDDGALNRVQIVALLADPETGELKYYMNGFVNRNRDDEYKGNLSVVPIDERGANFKFAARWSA